jgi:polyisoprenoid-binding protein YceI
MPLRKISLIGLALVICACGVRVTSTPLPTLTPTVPATDASQIPSYTIDDKQSIINYVATGPLNISLPGTFRTQGKTVLLVPEGESYRIKIDTLIDGNSVTAVNGIVRDALRSNLEVDKYPFGHFIADSKEIVKLGPKPTTFTASGTLELHGHTRTVEIPISATLDGAKMTATLETSVDLLDYEVNVPTAIMNSKVTFKAAIVAVQAPAANPSASTPQASTG